MPTPLSWPDCRNARDLGGLPTIDGGRIRADALIRADSLVRLNADGVAMVKAAGVRRIIDLRSVEEAQAYGPHPFSEDAEIYRLAPLIDPAREPERDKRSERTLADIYCSSLNRNTRSIVEGVLALADAPPGPVLVHCAAGKDRTGMLVALALTVAGVAPEVIAQDYHYTEGCLQADHESFLEKITDEVERKRAVERMSARPETMLAMLSHATDTFGGVREYLLRAGITALQLDAIQDRLREPE